MDEIIDKDPSDLGNLQFLLRILKRATVLTFTQKLPNITEETIRAWLRPLFAFLPPETNESIDRWIKRVVRASKVSSTIVTRFMRVNNRILQTLSDLRNLIPMEQLTNIFNDLKTEFWKGFEESSYV